MTTVGPIKSRAFCHGKKLSMFYAFTPPCRGLAVYTDPNNLILFVTWQGLPVRSGASPLP